MRIGSEIDSPMNSCTNALAGRSYTCSGVPGLFDAALVEDDDPIRDLERFFLVVR